MSRKHDGRPAAVLMGAPGSGKTTLSRNLAAHASVLVIETGNLLRAEAKRGTPLSDEIKSYQAAGNLVPSDTVKRVICAELDRADGDLVLFDGFPRNMPQTELLTEILESRNLDLAAVFIFEISLQTVLKRLGGRRVCPNCGAIYHIESNPPKEPGRCDKCGAELVQRPDDCPEVIKRRFENYENETMPVIKYFEDKCAAQCVRISVEGSAKDVVENVRKALKV